METDTSSIRLTDRDREIIDHVSRYRMTVREVVQQAFFPEADLNAVTKVLIRLTRAGILARHQLHDTRHYWTLSPKAVEQAGGRVKHGGSMGYDSIIHHYGVLAFCLCGEERWNLLTPQEFQERFPAEFDTRFFRPPYYIDVDDEDGTERLGLIVVDRGQDYLRFLRKCRAAWMKRLEIPAFRTRIEAGKFVIAVVTAHADKGRRLVEAFNQDESAILYRVAVRKGLAQLLVNHAAKR